MGSRGVLAILSAIIILWFCISTFVLGTPFHPDDDPVEEGEGVLEGRAMPAFEYPGATERRMHGTALGHREDGSSPWSPIPPPQIRPNMSELLRKGGGFNLMVSDSLPLDRDIMDARSDECRKEVYDISELPTATIVIIFYNEPFSTLIRTVHSALNRTPPSLLKEILLVDDGSNAEWIREGGSGLLEEYVNLLPKTILLRSPERRGIVSARMLGFRAATGDVTVILDSHCEVSPGWMEPLLFRIKDDPHKIVMPQIDGLDPETFEPRRGGIGCTLGFLWKLIEHSFDEHSSPLPDRRYSGPTDYVSSPAMAGGLFAAHTETFLSMGGYDERYQFWGTENLELSFHWWMCGGTLECSPCSRVYHVFRKGGSGYSSPSGAVTKNKMRLLTIWMDEYADLAWRVLGKPEVDFGPYEDNLELREELGCKNFEWFLREVNPEAEVQIIPRDVPHLGHVRHVATDLCLDPKGYPNPGGMIGVGPCSGDHQEFMYFINPKHIMPVTNDESCLGQGNEPGRTGWCHAGSQQWDVSDRKLRLEDIDKCLSVKESKLVYAECNADDPSQEWEFDLYNPPKNFTPPPPRIY